MKRQAIRLLLATCMAVAVCSFASVTFAVEEVSGGGGTTITADADYTIQEEDTLRLDVWGEQQLSGMQMQVTPGGKINVGYIGEMKAAGLTLTQLSDEIAKKFEQQDILRNPKIQITLITMHQPTVRVLGQVQRPGAFPFKEGDTIMDAIAMAGSYTQDALLAKATITHKGSSQQIPLDLKAMLQGGDLSHNEKLQKGDTIYIPPEDYQNKIYVMGQVLRPGMYPYKEKTSVLSAVNLAGGPTERGAMRSTVVVRGGPNKPERVSCNLARLFDKADMKQDIELHPGDVVYVPETKRPDLNKISQLLNIVLNLSYVRRTGLF